MVTRIYYNITPAWQEASVNAFSRHQRRYGTRRFQNVLHAKNHRVGYQRLCGSMRRFGLHALQPEPFISRTTDTTYGLRWAPNRLLNQPKLTLANQARVSDITQLPLANGDWV